MLLARMDRKLSAWSILSFFDIEPAKSRCLVCCTVPIPDKLLLVLSKSTCLRRDRLASRCAYYPIFLFFVPYCRYETSLDVPLKSCVGFVRRWLFGGVVSLKPEGELPDDQYPYISSLGFGDSRICYSMRTSRFRPPTILF